MKSYMDFTSTFETLRFERFLLMNDEEVKAMIDSFIDSLSTEHHYRILVSSAGMADYDRDSFRAILTDYVLKQRRTFNHGFVYGHKDLVMQDYYQKYNITTNTFTVTVAVV